MNNPITFSFTDSAQLRVVMLNGEPWFAAADACAVLGLVNPSKVVSKLDDDEKGITLMDTLGGAQQLITVNESGLYTLILRCDDAIVPGTAAHQFRKWVTADVLPSIRKNGSYQAGALPPGQRLAYLKERRTLARELAGTKEAALAAELYDNFVDISRQLGIQARPLNALAPALRQQNLSLEG